MQIVLKGQRHDGREEHHAGKTRRRIEPLAQIQMEADECEENKQPALQDIRVADIEREEPAEELGHEKLEQARLLVVRIVELKQ